MRQSAPRKLTTAPVEERDFKRTLRTVGVVTLDETRTAHVHAKVRGWIDTIHVDFTGQKVIGNGIDPDLLKKIHLETADAFVSATRGDNRNVMAAQVAKHIYGVKVVASRVFDPLREEMYRNMGLRTINPTRVQAKRLKRVIEAPTDEDASEMAREFMNQDGL